MFKIQGAVIKEQGQTFAIAIVKMFVLDSHTERENMANSLLPLFPRMPIVLMAQDSRGIPKYWGRKDIVNLLANIEISRIPWKEYTFS
jgi:hypothetical protein